jgi:hypothetical protein
MARAKGVERFPGVEYKDDTGPSHLPPTVSAAEVNRRNREFWKRQDCAQPARGEAAPRPKGK